MLIVLVDLRIQACTRFHYQTEINWVLYYYLINDSFLTKTENMKSFFRCSYILKNNIFWINIFSILKMMTSRINVPLNCSLMRSCSKHFILWIIVFIIYEITSLINVLFIELYQLIRLYRYSASLFISWYHCCTVITRRSPLNHRSPDIDTTIKYILTPYPTKLGCFMTSLCWSAVIITNSRNESDNVLSAIELRSR